jgi:nicotinamide-nucleotide adenylyltransferase
MKALFIGRFQPFHNGHLETVKWICSRADKLYIVLAEDHGGSNERNPYSREQREAMINKSLADENVRNYEIVYIPDHETVNGWYDAITNHIPNFDVLFTGNPWIEECFRKRGRKVEHQPIINEKQFNATEIRRRIKSGEGWEHLVPRSVVKVIKSR